MIKTKNLIEVLRHHGVWNEKVVATGRGWGCRLLNKHKPETLQMNCGIEFMSNRYRSVLNTAAHDASSPSCGAHVMRKRRKERIQESETYSSYLVWQIPPITCTFEVDQLSRQLFFQRLLEAIVSNVPCFHNFMRKWVPTKCLKNKNKNHPRSL